MATVQGVDSSYDSLTVDQVVCLRRDGIRIFVQALTDATNAISGRRRRQPQPSSVPRWGSHPGWATKPSAPGVIHPNPADARAGEPTCAFAQIVVLARHYRLPRKQMIPDLTVS